MALLDWITCWVSYDSSPIRKDYMDFPNPTAKHESVHADTRTLSPLVVKGGYLATNEVGLCTVCESLEESKTKRMKSHHAPKCSSIRLVSDNVFVLSLFFMVAFSATVTGFGWMVHILAWGNAVKVPSESDNLTATAVFQNALTLTLCHRTDAVFGLCFLVVNLALLFAGVVFAIWKIIRMAPLPKLSLQKPHFNSEEFGVAKWNAVELC